MWIIAEITLPCAPSLLSNSLLRTVPLTLHCADDYTALRGRCPTVFALHVYYYWRLYIVQYSSSQFGPVEWAEHSQLLALERCRFGAIALIVREGVLH